MYFLSDLYWATFFFNLILYHLIYLILINHVPSFIYTYPLLCTHIPSPIFSSSTIRPPPILTTTLYLSTTHDLNHVLKLYNWLMRYCFKLYNRFVTTTVNVFFHRFVHFICRYELVFSLLSENSVVFVTATSPQPLPCRRKVIIGTTLGFHIIT